MWNIYQLYRVKYERHISRSKMRLTKGWAVHSLCYGIARSALYMSFVATNQYTKHKWMSSREKINNNNNNQTDNRWSSWWWFNRRQGRRGKEWLAMKTICGFDMTLNVCDGGYGWYTFRRKHDKPNNRQHIYRDARRNPHNANLLLYSYTYCRRTKTGEFYVYTIFMWVRLIWFGRKQQNLLTLNFY